MSLKFLLLTFLFVSLNAIANTKLPEYTSKWYLSRQDSDVTMFENQCGGLSYEYKYKSDFPESLAALALADVPKHDDCTWGPIQQNVNDKDTVEPLSFPGTNDDWQYILANQGVRAKRFHRDCIKHTVDNKGIVEDTTSTLVFPIYHCPEKSRNYDSVDGCVTDPPVCDADIVGRDMDSKALWYLGHVGLTKRTVDLNKKYWYASQVLEVLDEDKVVNEDSFDSFSDHPNTQFWGEKFDPKNSLPIMSMSQANDVLQAGRNQEGSDATYSIFPTMKPGQTSVGHVFDQSTGKFISQAQYMNPVFRCDTFVYYCYKVGGGIKLLSTHLFSTPHTLFDAFIKNREVFPSNHTPFSPDKSNHLSSIDQPCTTIDCYKHQIELEISKHDDPNKLINLLGGLRKLMTTKDDVNYIYQEAFKSKDNILLFNSLMQLIQTPHPSDLISRIIKDYPNLTRNKHNSIKNQKFALLDLIRNLLHFPAKDGVDQLTQADISSIKSAQDFVHSLLNNDQEMKVREKAMMVYFSIAPIQQFKQDIINGPYQSAVKHDQALSKVFSTYLTMKLLSAPTATSLGKSIRRIFNLNMKQKLEFNRTFFALLSSVDSKKLPLWKQKLVLNYIEKQKPACVIDKAHQNRNCLTKYLSWFGNYSHFIKLSKKKRNESLFKDLLTINNPKFVSSVILSIDPKQCRSIHRELLEKLISHLHGSNNQFESNSLIKRTQSAISNLRSIMQRENSSDTPTDRVTTPYC